MDNQGYQKRIEKPWGYEIIFTSPDLPYTGKVMHLNAGTRQSLQIHDKKQETYLARGRTSVHSKSRRLLTATERLQWFLQRLSFLLLLLRNLRPAGADSFRRQNEKELNGHRETLFWCLYFYAKIWL